MTTSRISFFRQSGDRFAGENAQTQQPRGNYHAHKPIRDRLRLLYDLRPRRPLSPQSLEIVELTNLRSEHVDDHVAGINHHPVAIGQALDMDALDAVFLQGFA